MNRLVLLIMTATALLYSGTAYGADFIIHGVVSDVNGQPVTGAEVSLYRSKNVKKPADFASNKTTADGAYSVTVPQGHYWAVAALRKGERRFGPLELGDKHSGDPVEVVAEAEADLTHDFTIMDLREAAKQNQKKNADLLKLSGRIVDQNGSPAAMAYAMADKNPLFKEIPTYLSPWTDASGGYLLLLPKGKYYLGTATEYPPEPGKSLSTPIDLSTDKDGVDLKVTAQETVKAKNDADAD